MILAAGDLDAGLLPAGGVLVAAVSGGADSLALLDILARDGRWRVVAWHLDHGLRPESAAESAVVADRAAALGLVLRSERVDLRAQAAAWGVGLEEAGRRCRYQRLAAAAAACGAAAAVTAHHCDDQAETILLNLLRGAGPRGWGGIAASRPLAPGIALVRPALGLARARLRAHCRARGIAWCEDASNQDTRFRRNLVRGRVLPAFEAGCPGFTEALLRRAAAESAAYARLASAAHARLDAAWTADAVAVAPLAACPGEERRECLAEWLRRLGVAVDRSRLHRLADLVAGAPDRRLRLGPWLLLRRARQVTWRGVSPA